MDNQLTTEPTVTLTDDEITQVAAAAHCAPDKQIMASLRPVIESIIASRLTDQQE